MYALLFAFLSPITWALVTNSTLGSDDAALKKQIAIRVLNTKGMKKMLTQ